MDRGGMRRRYFATHIDEVGQDAGEQCCGRLRLMQCQPLDKALHATLTVLPALLVLLHEADGLDAEHHRLAQVAAGPVLTTLRSTANELGQLPLKQWAKQLNVGDPNGLKGYFKFLAVKHPKSFAVILARIMPLHVTTGAKKLPKYLTEEQMRSELRASGLPEDLIKFMHPVDVMSVDPDEVGDDPYPDPEADDEDMVGVTPKETE